MVTPRLMKHPNGAALSVDVTLLQIGLSRCRSIAANGMGGEKTVGALLRVLANIEAEAGAAMRGVADSKTDVQKAIEQ